MLEFPDIEDRTHFREAERGIIGKLRDFMLEMVKGFAFVARQFRVRTQTRTSSWIWCFTTTF